MAIMDLKWLGWIPRVSIPNPYQSTLAIFLIHHYFRTEMESLKSPRILIQRCFKKLGAEPFLVLERKRKLQLNRCQVSYISQKYISTPESQKYVSNPQTFGTNIRIELKIMGFSPVPEICLFPQNVFRIGQNSEIFLKINTSTIKSSKNINQTIHSTSFIFIFFGFFTFFSRLRI